MTNYAVRACVENLARHGIDLRRVFFVNELLLDDDSTYVFGTRMKKFERVYELWADGLSQWIYKSTVEARLSGQCGFLSRTLETPQYFSFLMEQGLLGDQEVFVDAGAYTGDTVAAFMQATDGRFRYIYAFEPDLNNCNILKNQRFGDCVLVYQYGLYDFDGQVNFESGAGSQSRIVLGANAPVVGNVSVRRLDSVALPDRHITLLKMDIEGSELKALQGARQLIHENHPKLAICVYHKIEDLWELPLYIKELCQDYRLYLRNHTDGLDEMVLYAV